MLKEVWPAAKDYVAWSHSLDLGVVAPFDTEALQSEFSASSPCYHQSRHPSRRPLLPPPACPRSHHRRLASRHCLARRLLPRLCHSQRPDGCGAKTFVLASIYPFRSCRLARGRLSPLSMLVHLPRSGLHRSDRSVSVPVCRSRS